MLAYIKLFTDYDDTFADMSDEEAGRLIKALIHYGATGEIASLPGPERLVFGILRRQHDRDNEDYQAFIEKQTENGKKGGRPRKNPENPTVFDKNPENPTENRKTQKSQEEDKDKDKEFIDDNEERVREGFSYQHTEIGTLVSTCLKAMTPRAWEELKVYMGEMPEDLIAWAVQTSCEHGGNNWAYVSAVLRGLQCAGIKSVEDAEKRSEEHRQKRGQHQQQTGRPSNIAQLNYSQREYPEQKPGELPDWYIRMLEDEQKAEAAKKANVQPEMPEWLAEMMIEEAAHDA